jgi:uncharacterized protein (TIGR02246 family)
MRPVVLAAILASRACGPADPADGRADAALKALREEYASAFNAGDATRVLALYAEDATLVSDGGTFEGRAAIAKWLQAGLAEGSRLEPITVVAGERSGTLAYETGRTRRHVGAEVHLGQYLIVMQRFGDDWRIVRHFSITTR